MMPNEATQPDAEQAKPLLAIRNLAVSFPPSREVIRDRPDLAGKRVRAVNGINLTVYPGQTLAVVGESGCGKSVSALSTLRLVPTPPGKYDQGQIFWQRDASQSKAPVDLLTINEKQMRQVRGGEIAMIFQEPMTSLNPVYTIGDQIMEAVLLHQKVTSRQAREICIAALTDVGIPSAASRMNEYPHQLSGGMRQRVMIAMALACQPRLLLADEPTTALDVTIQAQILELLRELQVQKGMAMLLITHDLGVVAENADVVAVMYAGRVVEFSNVVELFKNPLHPYTVGLFQSMPELGSRRERLTVIEGQVPSLSSERMEKAIDRQGKLTNVEVNANPTLADVIMQEGKPTRVFRRSVEEQPELREVKPGHWVACYDASGYDAAKATLPESRFKRTDALAKV